MMRRLLTGLVLLAPLAAAADPALLDFIMPDARLVVGVDIAQMRSSPLNSTFTDGVQSANPELRKLMDAAGFDPMRDLQELIFASPGIGKNPAALLVARGTFDVAKLRAFAESAGSKISDFGGVPILSDPEKDNGTFALLDNIILAGNRDQVKAAIERRGHGRILNTEMATRIAAVSKRYDAWIVSIAPLATMASTLPSEAQVDAITGTAALRAIEQFSFGVSLKSDIELGAELFMSNAKAANDMAAGLQMMMMMAQQNAKDQPGLAGALKNVNFGVDLNVVRLGLAVPVDEVQKAVQSAMNSQMKKSVPTMAVRQPEAEMPKIQSEPVKQDLTPTVQTKAAPSPVAPASVARSPRIPANAEILVQSSPKDMGTVVILGSKK